MNHNLITQKKKILKQEHILMAKMIVGLLSAGAILLLFVYILRTFEVNV